MTAGGPYARSAHAKRQGQRHHQAGRAARGAAVSGARCGHSERAGSDSVRVLQTLGGGDAALQVASGGPGVQVYVVAMKSARVRFSYLSDLQGIGGVT